MIAAVNPTSNGQRGGAFNPATRPTAVGGGFGLPGAIASTPPGVPASGILEARNNRGSNVQVPYARLVPMHGRTNPHAKDDHRTVYVDGSPALEYDGLRTGELAWILGRRFKDGTDELGESQRYAHQAYIGLGNGVDRMQRLASTKWVQALVKDKIGRGARIDLHALRLDSLPLTAMSDELKHFQSYLAGATALSVPDVTWWHAMICDDKKAYPKVGYVDGGANLDEGRRLQGVCVLETGPFLRGIQVEDQLVRFQETVEGMSNRLDMARNHGDTLAFSALESELRRKSMMDWTPDGIVLSKLESPTDEPMKSIEMDARSAQLFNVGVQGPSITTSWTSDVRDHRLEVQPMDKVFICLVATLSYTVDETGNANYGDLKALQNDVLEILEEIQLEKRNNNTGNVTTLLKQLETATKDVDNKSTAFVNELKGSSEPPFINANTTLVSAQQLLNTVTNDPSKSEDEKNYASKRVDAAQLAVDSILGLGALSNNDRALLMNLQQRLRKGTDKPTKAVLTNFRLERSTSSHMANYSYPRQGDTNSRLGLRIGKPTAFGDDGYSGAAEYVVGAWCIGSVTDAAASRSTIGNLVRTAPTSMAINLNVNVQWWSGDRLYKQFMDKSGLTLMRGQPAPLAPDGITKRMLDAVNEDATPNEYMAFSVQNPDFDPNVNIVLGQGSRQVRVAATAAGEDGARRPLEAKRQKRAPVANEGAGIGASAPSEGAPSRPRGSGSRRA